MSLRAICATIGLLALSLTGCGSNTAKTESDPSSKGSATSTMPNDPTHEGMKSPEKPKGDLTSLEKAANEARTAMEKSPKDEALKKTAVQKIFEEAEFVMYEADLPPKDKYTKALKLYREVVTLDPTHKTAKESITTIEDIYKSMGRPVPSG